MIGLIFRFKRFTFQPFFHPFEKIVENIVIRLQLLED